MPVRLTAYFPESAAERFVLAGDGLHLIGRAADCAVSLGHPSVSRRHAELWLDGGQWKLRDLDSKNGSFLEGARIAEASGGDRCWLRFGDIACELTLVDEEALARGADEFSRRRANATALTQAIGRDPARPDLMQATLDAIVELAGAERGFLLTPGEGGLEPKAWRGFSGTHVDLARFAGSTTAVARAHASRRPVVSHDLSLDAELAGRASVLASGLRAITCLPLVLGDDVLGIAYADSRRPGALVTRNDLELLEAFAERAAIWLAARRNQALLAAGTGAGPGAKDPG